MRFNRTAVSLLSVSLLGLASLAGCSSKPTAEAPTNSPETSTTTAMSSPAIPSGTAGLTAVVDNTKAAVSAGDFQKATAEFDKFESAWKPVEDGIKAKAPAAYDKIEAGMDQVTGALKASDKEKGLSALQSLNDTIQTVK
jgi:hypothetical protein